jgi:hypothetical protein
MTALTNTANAAKQTVAEYSAKIEEGLKASPEIIATEYARANAGNNRLMEDAGNIAGKFGAKIDDALNAANRKDYPQTILYPNAEGKSPEDYSIIKRVDKSPTLSGENTVNYLAPRMSVEETVKAIQANVKASGATAPAAIRAAVFDAFAGLSSPTPLNDSTLDKIADKLIIKQAHAPAATAPVKQFVGGTGIHNPVLGTAEEHFPLPLPNGTSTVSDSVSVGTSTVANTGACATVSDSVSVGTSTDGSGIAGAFTDALYQELKGRIVAREIEPMARPVKQLLKVWQVGRNDEQRQHVANEALDRMHGEGVLSLNPEQGKFKRKYLIA